MKWTLNLKTREPDSEKRSLAWGWFLKNCTQTNDKHGDFVKINNITISETTFAKLSENQSVFNNARYLGNFGNVKACIYTP